MKWIIGVLLILSGFCGALAREFTNDLKAMKFSGAIRQIRVVVQTEVPVYRFEGTNAVLQVDRRVLTNLYSFNRAGYMTEKSEWDGNGQILFRETMEYTNIRYLSLKGRYRNGVYQSSTLYSYSNDFRSVQEYGLYLTQRIPLSETLYDSDGLLLTRTVFNSFLNDTYVLSNVYNDRRQVAELYSLRTGQKTLVNSYVYNGDRLTAVSNFNMKFRFQPSMLYSYDDRGREVRKEEFIYTPTFSAFYRSEVTEKTYNPSGRLQTMTSTSANARNIRQVYSYDKKNNTLTIRYFDLEQGDLQKPYRTDRYEYSFY